MTPKQLRDLIYDSPKPNNWTRLEAHAVWLEYLTRLRVRHDADFSNALNSAERAYFLALAGADADEIAATYTLLFL